MCFCNFRLGIFELNLYVCFWTLVCIEIPSSYMRRVGRLVFADRRPLVLFGSCRIHPLYPDICRASCEGMSKNTFLTQFCSPI